jgi:pyridoxamine 5'-phosphate oxidase
MREELAGDPLDVLARWIADATAAGLPLPSTMTLATADGKGVPHARTVLVTAIDGAGVRFHSSRPTTKTRDLDENSHASAVFHWPALGRQVVLQGMATQLDAASSRAAFPTRPRQLQLLAWVYHSLTPCLVAPGHAVGRGAVERAFDDVASVDPTTLEMPPSWTTIRLVPDRLDFWQAGTDVTPPGKTRFVAEGDHTARPTTTPDRPAGLSSPAQLPGPRSSSGRTWRSFPVLP